MKRHSKLSAVQDTKGLSKTSQNAMIGAMELHKEMQTSTNLILVRDR